MLYKVGFLVTASFEVFTHRLAYSTHSCAIMRFLVVFALSQDVVVMPRSINIELFLYSHCCYQWCMHANSCYGRPCTTCTQCHKSHDQFVNLEIIGVFAYTTHDTLLTPSLTTIKMLKHGWPLIPLNIQRLWPQTKFANRVVVVYLYSALHTVSTTLQFYLRLRL